MHKKLLASSSGPEPYEVVFSLLDGKLRISCTCKAAAMNMACKHRLALIRGDISALASADQSSDLSEVTNWAENAGLLEIIVQHDLIETEIAELQGKLKKVKKRLVNSMDSTAAK